MLIRNLSLLILLAFLMTGAAPVNQFPEAIIANDLIRSRVYLPDSTHGYYRGTRFDWSGVMPELVYNGHSYFGKWFDHYDPLSHDAIMGPVEAFSPIGYDSAAPGEHFLVIGIGLLKRPNDAKYSFATTYPLVDPGVWKVATSKDQVSFNHSVAGGNWGYEYQKKIILAKSRPDMQLSHSLKNTGTATIETNVYNHNFFVMDNQTTGPGFVVKFPFQLVSETPATQEFGKLEGNSIVFSKLLSEKDHLFYGSLKGYSEQARDYDISIENNNTGAAVRITSDQPLSKLVFWSAHKTVCPEPYIRVKIEPGQTFHWNLYYHFYTCATNQ